jgi:hypothetical protein
VIIEERRQYSSWRATVAIGATTDLAEGRYKKRKEGHKNHKYSIVVSEKSVVAF